MQIANGKGETWRGELAVNLLLWTLLALLGVWIAANVSLYVHRGFVGGVTGPVKDGVHYVSRAVRDDVGLREVSPEVYRRLQVHEQITMWTCPTIAPIGCGMIVFVVQRRRKGQREDAVHYQLTDQTQQKRRRAVLWGSVIGGMVYVMGCVVLALVTAANFCEPFRVVPGMSLVGSGAHVVDIRGSSSRLEVSDQMYKWIQVVADTQAVAVCAFLGAIGLILLSAVIFGEDRLRR